MTYRNLLIRDLQVNRANDRHGELENETASIAWLFNTLENHMRNLAKDIVNAGILYEPPLVVPNEDLYIVFDGNRRVTCLKLLDNPRRAPTIELQEYFSALRGEWKGDFPDAIQCQVETDRDRIDEILFRRHTGSQSGVGQSTWDDRMKANFINRTGKGGGASVAEEIEKRLTEAGMLPRQKIPRANLNRLLSSEQYRNRVGFAVKKGKFEYTHQEKIVLRAMQRITQDLASKRLVLGHLWDTEGKLSYLDTLDDEGVLPKAEHSLTGQHSPRPSRSTPSQTPPPTKTRPSVPAYRPPKQTTLIPNTHFEIVWTGRLQRHKAIWEELQFHLKLSEHPNAISVLFRVLLEISTENYISIRKLEKSPKDTLAKRVQKAARHQYSENKISKRDLSMFEKFAQHDALISADTLNGYVHSANFAPSPEHLRAVWDALSGFIVNCLNAHIRRIPPNRNDKMVPRPPLPRCGRR